jgi:hypothetical protein
VIVILNTARAAKHFFHFCFDWLMPINLKHRIVIDRIVMNNEIAFAFCVAGNSFLLTHGKCQQANPFESIPNFPK